MKPGIITNNIVVIILLGLFSSIKFGPSAMNTIETIKNVITKWSIINAAIRLFLLDLRNVNSVVCSVIVVVLKLVLTFCRFAMGGIFATELYAEHKTFGYH